jgi:chlorophyll/bacteriochlorophyll a synthase
MLQASPNVLMPVRPQPAAVLELLKPITWFPPMWAYACGVISSGVSVMDHWLVALAGVLLAGPLICGTSQAVNDWFDRHVDAINEPNRPIPSGRVPGQWGLGIAIIWSFVSTMVAAMLGVWVLIAGLLGLAMAWAYSAPPFRLKQNGWWGNAAVGLCYEGLPWFTAAAALAGALPDSRVILVAALYSIGAHGIMTLNDFKSVEGDKVMGVRSLPVQLGVDSAVRLACWMMAIPQLAVIAFLFYQNCIVHGTIISVMLLVQLFLMQKLLAAPRERAPWYNGTGVTLYVLGMMVSAFAIRSLLQAESLIRSAS